jgi:hypothetical protein
MNKDTPIATDIYERIEMNKAGEGGSVHSDLEDIILEGNLQDFEDYFGDLDPFEFL